MRKSGSIEAWLNQVEFESIVVVLADNETKEEGVSDSLIRPDRSHLIEGLLALLASVVDGICNDIQTRLSCLRQRIWWHFDLHQASLISRSRAE